MIKDLYKHELNVILPVFNLSQATWRDDLFYSTKKHFLDMGATVWTIELVPTSQKHRVTDPHNPRDIRVIGDSMMLYKENLINIALQYIYSLVPSAQYFAWCDTDIVLVRPDWPLAVLSALHQYDIVQCFSHAQDLSPSFEPLALLPSWASLPHDSSNPNQASVMPTGFAWAANKSWLTKVGGLCPFGLMGYADLHTAQALYGILDFQKLESVSSGYALVWQWWQDKVTNTGVKVGYIPGMIYHYWHGSRADRGYKTRWELMQALHYDPLTMVRVNNQYVCEWVAKYADICNIEMSRSFALRNEESKRVKEADINGL